MKKQMTPCFWFDGKAREAAEFYCGIFRDARITSSSHLVTEFEASGQMFICLDGGPQFLPNPSISFYYICETEAELDRIWNACLPDGKVLMPLGSYPWGSKYGWIQDPYGVSWQVAVGDLAEVGQKITPCLLFTGNNYGRAEEAINHYASVFPGYALDGILRYGPDEAPDREGLVKHAQFALNSNKLMVMESAQEPHFPFTEGISLTVYCETQEEIDHYWNKLTENGRESMCGWLSDRFGVSWQIIPTVLVEIMQDPARAQKAARAFMEMRKFNIEQLIQASI